MIQTIPIHALRATLIAEPFKRFLCPKNIMKPNSFHFALGLTGARGLLNAAPANNAGAELPAANTAATFTSADSKLTTNG